MHTLLIAAEYIRKDIEPINTRGIRVYTKKINDMYVGFTTILIYVRVSKHMKTQELKSIPSF